MYSDPNLDTPPPRSQFRRPWSPEEFVPYHHPSSARDADGHGYGYGYTETHHDADHHHQNETQDIHVHVRPRSRGTSPHRRQQQRQRRREASDVSVEALDLADYAWTLRFRQAEDPYPPFPSQIRNGNDNGNGNGDDGRRLGSSMPVIPGLPGTRMAAGVGGASSLASLPSSTQARPPPNSLVSRGTLSSNSNATHQTLSSAQSRGRQPSRRPFSMPVTPQASSSRGHFAAIADPYSYPHSNSNRGPYSVDPETDVRTSSTQEIDISHFPKWSRGWYNNYNNHPASPDAVDLYDPIPPSRLNFDGTPNVGVGTTKSPFDPAYVHDRYNNNNNNNNSPYGSGTGTGMYDLPSSPPPPLSSVGHGSSRDLLPWSNDPPEYGPTLDPLQKEERMRMLEREFGGKNQSKGKGKGKDDGMVLVDEEGRPLVGTVDERGRLVTVGPKRRVVFRTMQVLLAVGACVPALYAAVAIKPLDPKKPPPPANKPPVLVLYVLSILTLLLLLYMFVIRPCCIVRHKPRSSSSSSAHGPLGMMVLPVGNGIGIGGKKGKKGKAGGKKGKGKGNGRGEGDVQVNLIVDPEAFRLPGEDEDEDSEDGSSSDSEDYELGKGMPGGFGALNTHNQKQKHKKKRRKDRRRHRRRGIREGLIMEEQWRVARAWAKKLTMLDVAGVVLWGAAFVFIMLGKRCPSGEFNGWCNAYNVSTASACLLCVAFGVSLFFDVQDLYASKQSPRTRTK